MFIDLFWKGIIIGISASIPMGPVGVLCVNKTLNKGRISGFVTGSGAALADALYAIIAGFGISFIIDFVVDYQNLVKVLGGMLVFYFGYKLFTTNPAKQLRKQMKTKGRGLWGDFLTSFALTISNPVGLFVFGIVFAGFGLLAGDASLGAVLVLIFGVISGAILWWFTLSTLVSIFRNKFRLRRLLYVNKVSGVIVMVFGLFIFVTIFLPRINDNDLPKEYRKNQPTIIKPAEKLESEDTV
jgi:threonine/homoserine/homoserine lactone efflux protein